MRKVLFLLIFLNSCSFFNQAPGFSPQLVPASGLKELAPGFYKSEQMELYLAQIQDCRKQTKVSLESLARQLLVGFKDIQIIKQTDFIINNLSIKKTIAFAKFEEQELELTYYTYKSKCLHDFVFWHKSNLQINPDLIENYFLEVSKNDQL